MVTRVLPLEDTRNCFGAVEWGGFAVFAPKAPERGGGDRAGLCRDMGLSLCEVMPHPLWSTSLAWFGVWSCFFGSCGAPGEVGDCHPELGGVAGCARLGSPHPCSPLILIPSLSPVLPSSEKEQ